LSTANNSHQISNISTTRPTASIRTSSYADAASSTLAPSTYAPSTLNGYAPSAADTNASLLNGQHPRPRYASEPSLQKKTKGRKAFVGLCDAINIIVPIDINKEATSMSESSLIQTGRAIQEMVEKRRSSHAGGLAMGRGDDASGQA
jgi:hypothetical protein